MKPHHPPSRRAVLAVYLFAASVLDGPCHRAAFAQSSAQEERVAAAFVLALGRTPTRAEAERSLEQGALTIADLIARQRRVLQADDAARRDVMARADIDAFGRTMQRERAPRGTTDGNAYVDVVREHLQWLAEQPAEYEQVIQRAYRTVPQRDAYSVEIDYWKPRPALTFALLAGCIENWAVRNQPGLMATTGTASISVNSAYLATVRLSPPVAAEARAVIGLPPAGGRTSASAAGRHVIAPGAAEIISVGGIHFAAAGDDKLRELAIGR